MTDLEYEITLIIERPRRRRGWGEPYSSPERDENSLTHQDRDDCAADICAHEGVFYVTILGIFISFERKPKFNDT